MEPGATAPGVVKLSIPTGVFGDEVGRAIGAQLARAFEGELSQDNLRDALVGVLDGVQDGIEDDASEDAVVMAVLEYINSRPAFMRDWLIEQLI